MTTDHALTCRVCGHSIRLYVRKRRLCDRCYTADQAKHYQQRKATTGRGYAVQPKPDPCPRCGIPQAQHWRCANCESRGHEMGRGVDMPHLCGWCEGERRASQA